jgi:restriction system protein
VKLKMANNSLFAVLLRSPWWISFGLVLLVALASRALLPEQYVPFGVMGGFPFLVIGGIAAYRQLRAPGEEEIAQTMATLATMPWSDFCNLLEKSYGQLGYAVTRLKGDAADLQLVKAGSTTIVSAKRWKAGNHGVDAVRALAQARSTRDASKSVYVTLGALGDNARRFAQQNQVDVLTGMALAQLVRKGLPASKA